MKHLLVSLLIAGCALGASQKTATMHVGVIVRPGAKIEVRSRTSVVVGVTMYPNAQALVWTAAGSCGAPQNPKVIPSSGIHHLGFSLEEVQAKDMVCLTSSDGVLRTSAHLQQ